MATEASEELPLTVSLIGDSNVQRNLVDYNFRGREIMINAQMLPCTSISTFAGCLTKIRPISNILILSILSNFLRDSEAQSDSGLSIWYLSCSTISQ